jgi:hypothetical protein
MGYLGLKKDNKLLHPAVAEENIFKILDNQMANNNLALNIQNCNMKLLSIIFVNRNSSCQGN